MIGPTNALFAFPLSRLITSTRFEHLYAQKILLNFSHDRTIKQISFNQTCQTEFHPET
jgi:hypothetical protein